jgi:hypothetical protein
MLRKRTSILIFIFCLTFCSSGLAGGPTIPSLADNKILEKPIRAEVIFKLGSDKINEDFYKYPAFAVGQNRQIYILDSGNSRIQCFSKEGNFLFGFGRLGQGPGEFSPEPRIIKILSDGNIYVIDNPQRRINIFNQEGKFLRYARMSAWYSDIVLLNGTYYLANIILKENHKPIHVSRSLEKIDSDWGIFIEPAVGILKQISQLPMPEPWRISYSDSNFAKLAATNRGELIYSQYFPYRLIKYDVKGRILKDIMGEVDFDTYLQAKFEVDRLGGTSLITSPQPGVRILLNVNIKNDNQVVVSYINPDKSIFYLDIYDLDLKLISRYRLVDKIADPQKGEYIIQSLVDDDNNLYTIVVFEEDYPKLIKYRLIFD